MATLDEQLQVMQDKITQINSLKAKRLILNDLLTKLTGNYDPVNNPATMENPLGVFAIGLSYAQITSLSEEVKGLLAIELAAVEQELSTLLV